MTTKLTLSIDKEVISSAKKYAEGTGKSLSGLIENYLKSIVAGQAPVKTKDKKVNALRGSMKLPKDFDYKTTLGNEIQKRFAR